MALKRSANFDGWLIDCCLSGMPDSRELPGYQSCDAG
jgi:hypothetical protein